MGLTNTDMLEAYIMASGKKKTYLARKCGLSLAGFRNCCTNRAEFKASHINILSKELGVKTLEERHAIFFDNDGA